MLIGLVYVYVVGFFMFKLDGGYLVLEVLGVTGP